MFLEVNIPSYYKNSLSRRFNYRNRVQGYEYIWILEPCPLCKDFGGGCSNCPFERFKIYDEFNSFSGCEIWIHQVLGGKVPLFLSPDRVSWLKKDNNKVKELLSTLRREAKKLITWTKEK
jgi:hypothetical protein